MTIRHPVTFENITVRKIIRTYSLMEMKKFPSNYNWVRVSGGPKPKICK